MGSDRVGRRYGGGPRKGQASAFWTVALIAQAVWVMETSEADDLHDYFFSFGSVAVSACSTSLHEKGEYARVVISW